MRLIKIGPARMDSFARQVFAAKVESRLRVLERQIAELQAARRAPEEGRGVQLDDLGETRVPPVGWSMDDTVRIAEELQRLQKEMAQQLVYQRQVEEAEAKFENAITPEAVELPGGSVLPPLFPEDRQTPLMLDLPQTVQPKTGPAGRASASHK
jgi:hypothetical protein